MATNLIHGFVQINAKKKGKKLHTLLNIAWQMAMQYGKLRIS
jgi:hypothetical protein